MPPAMRRSALQALLTLRHSAARWVVGSAAGPQTIAACAAARGDALSLCSAGSAAAEADLTVSCALLPQPPALWASAPAASFPAVSAEKMVSTATRRSFAVVATGLSSAEGDGAASSGLLNPDGHQRPPCAASHLFPSHIDRSVTCMSGAAMEPPAAAEAMCRKTSVQLQGTCPCDAAATADGHGDQSQLTLRRSSTHWLAAFAAVSASPDQVGSICSAAPRNRRRGGWQNPVQPWPAQRGSAFGQHWHMSSPLPTQSGCTSLQPPGFHSESRCRGGQLHCYKPTRIGRLRLADARRGQAPCRACAAQQARGFATPRSSGGAWSKGFQVPNCYLCGLYRLRNCQRRALKPAATPC